MITYTPEIKKTVSNAYLYTLLSFLWVLFLGVVLTPLKLGIGSVLIVFGVTLWMIFKLEGKLRGESALKWYVSFVSLFGISTSPLIAMMGIQATLFAALLAIVLFSWLMLSAHKFPSLTKYSNTLFCCLLALTLVSLVVLFFGLSWFVVILCSFSLVLFSFLTVVDVQNAIESGETNSLIIAVQLFLNLLNMFQDILILFGLMDD